MGAEPGLARATAVVGRDREIAVLADVVTAARRGEAPTALVVGEGGIGKTRLLAEAMTIARPTATRVLDGLEARRLIRRRAGDTDAREQRIHPTAEAEAIHDGLNAASGQVTRRLKALLGPAVFEQTVSKIRAVRTAIGDDAA